MNLFFEVTYRGVTAQVEPANGSNRWEIRFSDSKNFSDDEWCSLGVGNYPEVSLDEARRVAVERCKEVRPQMLAGLYRERERLQARITELEAL